VEIKIADVPQIREAALVGSADITTTTLKFLDDTHIVVGMNFSSAPDMNAGQSFRATVVSNATIVIIDPVVSMGRCNARSTLTYRETKN
jgi:hypothetical protein